MQTGLPLCNAILCRLYNTVQVCWLRLVGSHMWTALSKSWLQRKIGALLV